MIQSRSYAPLLVEAGVILRDWAKASEVVVLAATRSAADEFVRTNAGAGLLGVHRFTLLQFAASVAAPALADGGLSMVSGLGSEALAARAAFELNSSGRLGYFGPVASTPGFARVLAGTLSELRSQGVGPAELERVGKPGVDLARLGSFCKNELATRSLADVPMLFELAAEASHRLLGLPLICLDPEISDACEERFLTAVVGRAAEALAIHLSDDRSSSTRLGRIFGVQSEGVAELAGNSSLDSARRWLFSPRVPEVRTANESVQFFSAAGEGMECVEIARRIVSLAENGAAFDEVAVVLRDPRRYQALVEEALRRAAIPAYFSQGASRPDSAGRAFLALLACAAEGCSASRFAEYLSLAQVPDGHEMLAGWEKLLVDAAVIGGPARWERRLRGLQEEFRARLNGAADATEKERIEHRIAQLDHLETFALPLIARLDALPRRASWGQWLEWLNALADSSLRSPASVLSVLEELEPMSEVGPVEVDEVYGVLEDRLRFLQVEPDGRRYGSVFVCSIEEVRGRQFPLVFVPGLAEGVFPRRSLENPLLLDRYRIELNAGLFLKDDSVARERLLLIGAVACASRQLTVSYPSMDTTLSRPRVPSFYALEIVRAVEGRLPDLAAFKKRTAAAAHTRLSWPAPEDPRYAIDDAEYDLASLRPAIEGKRGAKSSARYLMEVNVHLARSLRARGRRWRPGWFDADGLVDLDGGALDVLRQYSLTRRSYSPSALQQFAVCPYRFALRAIFNLSPREDAVALEQLDPLTRGALFHRAQFEYFRESVKSFETGDLVFTRVAAEYEERLAPAISRVWTTAIEDLRIDFRAWIRDVAEHESDWSPLRFEFGFGLQNDPRQPRDPSSTAAAAVILDGYQVRGSMDLVEQHETSGALRIVDHKTGKPPVEIPVSVGRGTVLQPLLYALAGAALWGKPVESGRLFYCTQRGGYQRIDIAITQEGRDRLLQVLRTIEEAIQTGFLPAAPGTDACKTCDYQSVCGPYEEERLRRKKTDPLEPLHALRGLP